MLQNKYLSEKKQLLFSTKRITNTVELAKDFFSLDILLVSKISKHQFFRDISNSCHWVTQMRLKPHQNIFFEKKNKKLKPLAPSKVFYWFRGKSIKHNYVLNILIGVE